MNILYEILIVILCIIIFLTGLAFHYDISLTTLLVRLTDLFYLPHYNLCEPGQIGGVNVNAYIYLLIAFAAVSLIIFRKAQERNEIAVSCEVPANAIAKPLRALRFLLDPTELDDAREEIEHPGIPEQRVMTRGARVVAVAGYGHIWRIASSFIW